jgi:DNA-directed RNA polymerase subunit RPC12/RpoP
VPRDLLSKVRCPGCGGPDIRSSQRGGILDNIMTMFRRSPYRCRNCRRRFFILDSSKPEPAVEEKEEKEA